VFQSRGALVKSNITLWQGPVSQWPGSAAFPNLRWGSYSEIYKSQLWVSTVVDKRGKAAARLPFKVYQRDAQGRSEAGSTPFGMLMARPSKSIDPFAFWLWTVATKDIYGEAVWLKERDRGGRPVELIPLHPTNLVDEVDRDGRLTWKIRLHSGDIEIRREDFVLHREYHPDAPHRGLSKLEALRATLENEDGARRANSALWRNGGRPSVVLEHPALLNDGAVSRIRAQWHEIHGGVDNWAKAAILEEGMKANVVPLNVDELQYIEARRLNREEVCGAYDVPPPVVHILDRATFSNITEQMRSMYRDTMGPVLGSLESTVEFELRDGRFGQDRAPDFGDNVYGEFLLDEVLRGAFEVRAEAYQKADYMTLAEKREKENLPFLPGTEQIFLNSATLPLGPEGFLVQPEPAPAEQLALPPGNRSAQHINLNVTKPPTEAEIAEMVAKMRRPLANGGVVRRQLVDLGDSGPEIVLQPAEKGARLDVNTIRTVMGRVSRVKSLAAVDPTALVEGLNGAAVPVLEQLVAAQLAGDTVEGFRGRLRALPPGKD
jgi:HK97 family phage portal protein